MTEHWMQALPRNGRGVRFDLGAPTPDMVDFHAMATVLAGMPRFTRHTERGGYSVAQHSVEGAYAIFRDTGRHDHAAAFLVHDGHEYVIGDWATPVQGALGYYAILESGDLAAADLVHRAMRTMKASVDQAIYTAARIPWPLDPETARVVRSYDMRMCRTERDARLAPPPELWHPSIEECEPVQGCDLEPWTEEHARRRFVSAILDLLPRYAVDSTPSRG